jgi:hypothetical protein
MASDAALTSPGGGEEPGTTDAIDLAGPLDDFLMEDSAG